MADKDVKVKTTLDAENKTDKAFKEVGQNVAKLQGSTGSLASGLKTLGLAGAALYVGSKLFSYFKEGISAALEQEKANLRLQASLQQLGASFRMPEIDFFVDQMKRLGQAGTETTIGLTTLIRATKNVNASLYLSKLASDLAASGMGDYQGNIDALTNLMLGRFRAAAQQFGINIKENTDALSVLNEIQKKVTVTQETMANTAAGQAQKFKTEWLEAWETIGTAVLNAGAKVTNFLQNLIFGKKYMDDLKAYQAEVDKMQKEQSKKEAEAAAKRVTDQESQKSTLADLKDAWRTFSKNVVQSMDDQLKAVGDLRKSLNDLNNDLDKSVSKSKEKYNEDIKNLARRASQRIEEIDKDIENERASQGAGFRTRIEQLEQEKAKEQAIIDKAGGIVTNIKAEIAKDEFDILREAHDKEIKEMQDQAARRRAEIENEIRQREEYLRNIQKTIGAANIYGQATTQGTSFLGAIGAAPIQQQINFTFNGAVSDIEALKKAVIDALNRIATLKGVGGK